MGGDAAAGPTVTELVYRYDKGRARLSMHTGLQMFVLERQLLGDQVKVESRLASFVTTAIINYILGR